MNLQQITAGMVAAVNPMVPCILQVSTGSTVGADFTRTPSYAPAVTVQGQIQALSFRDIMQVEGLNLQGTRRAIYLQGDIEGIVRSENKGGDLLTFPDGSIWICAMVLENWNPPDGTNSGWVKICATLQNNS